MTDRAARSYSYDAPYHSGPEAMPGSASKSAAQPLIEPGLENREYENLAFGGAYQPGTNVTVEQRYTYTGREKNPTSDLMYYRYRQYDPRVGRFGGRPPEVGDELYPYASANPIRVTDALGLPMWEYTGDNQRWREQFGPGTPGFRTTEDEMPRFGRPHWKRKPDKPAPPKQDLDPDPCGCIGNKKPDVTIKCARTTAALNVSAKSYKPPCTVSQKAAGKEQWHLIVDVSNVLDITKKTTTGEFGQTASTFPQDPYERYEYDNTPKGHADKCLKMFRKRQCTVYVFCGEKQLSNPGVHDVVGTWSTEKEGHGPLTGPRTTYRTVHGGPIPKNRIGKSQCWYEVRCSQTPDDYNRNYQCPKTDVFEMVK